MRTKLVLTLAAVLFAAFTPLWTQPNVETLTVDTLCYLGKEALGKSAGAQFLPDGNIIALWNDTPLIIDSKTGEILRRLDSLKEQEVQHPRISPDGRYLIAYSWKGTAIWEVQSGKIIKFIGNANDYRFSPDGTKLYVCGGNSSKLGAIRVFDINTFEEIERFGSFSSGMIMDISPDGQTLAVSAYRKPDNEYDKKTNLVILIDLKDKTKYTVLETLEPQVYSMVFSPDGKTIAYAYVGRTPDVYICICNLETKEKKYIYESELQNFLGINSSFGNPKFINMNTLIFVSSLKHNPYDVDITLTWDIFEHSLKKIFLFYSPDYDIKNSQMLMCSPYGALAILDSQFVEVNDNSVSKESFLIYKNFQIEYSPNKSFIGQSTVYDTTGKMVVNIGSQQFIQGKNIININQPLLKGVYILTINDKTEQLSYKFMVE